MLLTDQRELICQKLLQNDLCAEQQIKTRQGLRCSHSYSSADRSPSLAISCCWVIPVVPVALLYCFVDLGLPISVHLTLYTR